MERIPWFRIAAVALPPAVVAVWLSIPTFQPPKQVAQGAAQRSTACLVVCAEVIEVSGIKLGCSIDLLGVPYACPKKVVQSAATLATYVSLPSAAKLFGLAATEGTLVRLEHEGRVVYSRSVAHQVWSAMYGGWVFNTIYWSVAGFIIWRWPRSRFSKRVAWQDREQ